MIDAIVLADAKLNAGHDRIAVGGDPRFAFADAAFRIVECQLASRASYDAPPRFGLAGPKSANSAAGTMFDAVISRDVSLIVEGKVKMVAVVSVTQRMAGFAC